MATRSFSFGSLLLVFALVTASLAVSAMPASAMAPVVWNDRPAQSVYVSFGIAPVTVFARDAKSDLPLYASTTWNWNGGSAHVGLPLVLTLTNGTCTSDGGLATCSWVLEGVPMGPPGAYVVTVKVSDDHGNVGSTDIAIDVMNYPPTADAGGPYTVVEGGQVTLNGTGSDPGFDPLTFAWDLNNDHTFETLGQNVIFSAVGRDGPDTQIVVLQVCDDLKACTTSTTTVFITNVAPVVSNDRPTQTVLDHDPIAPVKVSATDVIGDIPLSATTSWTKDGGSAQVGLPAGLTLTAGACTPSGGTGACVWTLEGSANVAIGAYVVTVVVSDDDGGTSSTTIAITVENHPPEAHAGGPYTVVEGGQITLNGAGSDPANDPLTYAWDLDNNGTFETPGQSVTFSAVGRDGPDTQTVVLQVCDDKGACVTSPATVTITNAAPVASNDRPAQSVQYSDAIAAVTVSATDVKGDLPLSASSSWTVDGGAAQAGLPTGLTLTAGACTPSNGTGTCTWVLGGRAMVAPGAYVVTVSASDHDGGAGSTSIAVTVQPEDARASYTGPTLAGTVSHSSSNASVPLSATVRDITAVDPASDTDFGDIRNATVAFVNRGTGATLCTAPVTLVNPSDTKTGTAACNWDVTIAGDRQSFTIGIVVGGYYLRNSAADDVVVIVTKNLVRRFLPFAYKNPCSVCPPEPGGRLR